MRPGYDAQTLLQRVLTLEREQGFQDRAAVGGLEAFARQQLDRAGSSAPAGVQAAVSILANYSQADRRVRESTVASALRALLTGVDADKSRVSVAGVEQREPGSDSRPNSRAAAPVRAHSARQPARAKALQPPAPSPSPPEGEGLGQGPQVAQQWGGRGAQRHTAEDLDTPLTSLKGMRKATAQALAHLGVATVRDALLYFPRMHYDYTDTRSISRMRVGEKTTLVGTIQNVRNNRTPRGIVITTAAVADDTGTVAVRWFNQPYLAKNLPVGARIAISGEADVFNGYITFQPRDYELIEDAELTHAARLVPMYPLTKGLYQKSVRRLIHNLLDEYGDALEDFLPGDLQQRLRLPALPRAVRQYHFPDDEEEKAWAEQRLAFDELFVIQLGLLMRKQEWQRPEPDVAVSIDEDLLERYCHALPFALTSAQRRVIAEILEDMARPIPMSRLLQGDVGSGKTVVAGAALAQIALAGKQGVLMAPTEILAEQHFRTVRRLLDPFGVNCELLIGSTPKARRKAVYQAVRDGSAQVVVGTHALIQEGLEFARLGLAITDEQHRFGVEQRATLRQKGLHPHILAMTATPIPRSLAMTIYGDLDVSAIDEMPPGRMPVITTWSRMPVEAYGVVRDEVRKGRQAFVICPVIEESMESDMRSVIAEHKELQQLTFPDLKVGLLHGRMKPSEKERTLEAFRTGEYHVLVATSVVEVGIDVPNATVMVIRDAHRFGLAQLHQFRGRVGRGGDQAFCVLLSATEGDEARERLEALTATDNGFELAEEDLRLRGPGEFWGTRQSGLPELRVARLGDVATIQLARKVAQEVLASDPDLSSSQNVPLRQQVERFWAQAADLS